MKYSIVSLVLFSLFCFSPHIHARMSIEPVGQAEICHNFRDWLSTPAGAQLGGRVVFHDFNVALSVTGGYGWPYLNGTALLEGEDAVRRLIVTRESIGAAARYLITPYHLIGGYYYHDWFDVNSIEKPKSTERDYRQHVFGVEGIMLPFHIQIGGHITAGLPNVNPTEVKDSRNRETVNVRRKRERLQHWVSYDEWGGFLKLGYRYSTRFHPFVGGYLNSLDEEMVWGGLFGIDYAYTSTVNFKFKAMVDTKHNPYVQCGVGYTLGGHRLGNRRLKGYLHQTIDRHVVPLFPGSDIHFGLNGKPKGDDKIDVANRVWIELHRALGVRSVDQAYPSEKSLKRLERAFKPIKNRWYDKNTIQKVYEVLVEEIEAHAKESIERRSDTGSFSRSKSQKPKQSGGLFSSFSGGARSGGMKGLGINPNLKPSDLKSKPNPSPKKKGDPREYEKSTLSVSSDSDKEKESFVSTPTTEGKKTNVLLNWMAGKRRKSHSSPHQPPSIITDKTASTAVGDKDAGGRRVKDPEPRHSPPGRNLLPSALPRNQGGQNEERRENRESPSAKRTQPTGGAKITKRSSIPTGERKRVPSYAEVVQEGLPSSRTAEWAQDVSKTVFNPTENASSDQDSSSDEGSKDRRASEGSFQDRNNRLAGLAELDVGDSVTVLDSERAHTSRTTPSRRRRERARVEKTGHKSRKREHRATLGSATGSHARTASHKSATSGGSRRVPEGGAKVKLKSFFNGRS
jgi:hypothetical protein